MIAKTFRFTGENQLLLNSSYSKAKTLNLISKTPLKTLYWFEVFLIVMIQTKMVHWTILNSKNFLEKCVLNMVKVGTNTKVCLTQHLINCKKIIKSTLKQYISTFNIKKKRVTSLRKFCNYLISYSQVRYQES